MHTFTCSYVRCFLVKFIVKTHTHSFIGMHPMQWWYYTPPQYSALQQDYLHKWSAAHAWSHLSWGCALQVCTSVESWMVPVWHCCYKDMGAVHVCGCHIIVPAVWLACMGAKFTSPNSMMANYCVPSVATTIWKLFPGGWTHVWGRENIMGSPLWARGSEPIRGGWTRYCFTWLK